MQCSRCRGLSRSTDRAFVPVLMLNELWSWFTARLASAMLACQASSRQLQAHKNGQN